MIKLSYFDEIYSRLKPRTLFEVVKMSEVKGLSAFVNVYVIIGALQVWINSKPRIMRWFWRRKYTMNKLSKKLNLSEITKLVERVYILEDLDFDLGKKKVKTATNSPQ